MTPISGSVPLPDVDEAERQDLSAADEQELRAFLEKRKWFESKLELLESLPPIYPFVHPVLVAGADDHASFVRVGEARSPWRLPTAPEIAAWTAERDAIEEQVEAFDGGDMERMKAKTRQVTRIPLTQPSTDLVEVTLDLILLIDRLLKVLRQRGAALGLAGLRLQWDELRWAIMLETARVRTEIDDLVRGRGRWVPPGGNDPNETPVKDGLARPRRVSDRYQTPPPRTVSLPHSLPSGSPLPSSRSRQSLTDVPLSPTASLHSPSRASHAHTPQRALHLPILHSQLAALQTRQRSLTSTTVAQSGSTIDKMIDAAAELRGLGGVDGPVDDDDKEGAVPEPLIILQEDLEGGAREAAERIRWCRLLEEQWKRADAHYHASTRARGVAATLMDSLQTALQHPPSAGDCEHLDAQLRQAQALLPPKLDASFPQPKHAAYPDNDVHNADVVAILADARDGAIAAVEVAETGARFYADLLAERDKLLGAYNAVSDLATRVQQLGAVVKLGTELAPRPPIDYDGFGLASDAWHGALPAQLADTSRLVEAARNAAQEAMATTVQYRKAMQAPMAAQPFVPADGLVDPLIADVEARSADLLAAAATLADGAAAAERDHAVHRHASTVREHAERLRQLAADAKAGLVSTINEAAWPGVGALNIDDARLKTCANAQHQLAEAITVLDATLVRQGRTLADARRRLKDDVDAANSAHDEVLQHASTLHRVIEQAHVTRSIGDEAQSYVNALAALERDIEACPDDDGERATVLGKKLSVRVADIETWQAGLSARAIFVSSAETDDPIFKDQTAPPATSGGTVDPYTPPHTPGIVDDTTLIDLTKLDGRVRAEINHHAASVSAALVHADDMLQDLPARQWSAASRAAADALRQAIERLDASRGDAEARFISVMQAPQDGEGALENCLHDLERVRAALDDSQGTVEDACRAQRAVEALVTLAPASREHERQASARLCADATAALDASEVLYADVEAATQRVAARLAAVRDGVSLDSPVPNDDDSDLASLAAALRERLDALNLPLLVRPSSRDVQASPSLRRLPSAETAQRVRAAFQAVSAACSELDGAHDAVVDLKGELIDAQPLVDALSRLGDFAGAVKRCDKGLSDLVDALDGGPFAVAEIVAEVQSRVSELDAAFEVDAVRHDVRVAAEHRRVRRAWDELRAMVDEAASAASHVADDDAVSEVGSQRAAALTHRAPPAASSRQANARAVSQPLHALKSGDGAIRMRAVSDTPSRLGRARASASTRGPAHADGSMIPRATRTPRVPASAASSRPSSQASTRGPRASLNTSTSTSASTPRARSSSRGRLAPTYVADPASKLDVAVARVVNKLSVHLPVRAVEPVVPVGLDAPAEWKDQSGRYWIGAEGRARLCFCRILRSRTVMVRVGGGWVELSKFLLDHFADAIGAWQVPPDTPAVPALPGGAGATPGALTASALRQSRRADGPASPRPRQSSLVSARSVSLAHAPATPMPRAARASLPLGAGAVTTPTPPRAGPASAAASPGGGGAGGSPLVPLHFIKRASESPLVRDKEREDLRASRRGILGREGSVPL